MWPWNTGFTGGLVETGTLVYSPDPSMKWVEIRHEGDGNRGAAYVADVPGGVLVRTVTHLILHTGLYVSEALAFVPNVGVVDFERKPKDED